MELVEHIKEYWAIYLFIITVLWHLFNKYFAFNNVETKLNTVINESAENKKKIDEFTLTHANSAEKMYNKILIEIEKSNKEVLVHVLEQEKSNNANNAAWAKIMGDIGTQLSNINLKLDTHSGDMKKIFSRVESMEKEKFEELKEKLSAYRDKHNKD